MASRKNTDHYLRKFFMAFFALFVVVGGILALVAVQNPTNTQSNAADPCIMTPQVSLIDSTGSKNSTTYNLKILNMSGLTACDQVDLPLYYSSDPSIQPQAWRFDFTQYGGTRNFAYGHLEPKQKNKVQLKVTPPWNLENGTYKLHVKVCASFPHVCSAGDCGDGPNADEILSNISSNLCSKIEIKYIKTKN